MWWWVVKFIFQVASSGQHQQTYANGIGPRYRLAIYGLKIDQTFDQKVALSVRIKIGDRPVLGPISVHISIGHFSAYSRCSECVTSFPLKKPLSYLGLILYLISSRPVSYLSPRLNARPSDVSCLIKLPLSFVYKDQ